MHAVTAVQWAGDGTDLLVTAEDGYVRALRVSGRTADGVPVVGPPERLQEYGAHLSVGAKACPNVVDWDGDGREDLVIGNAAGQVMLCRNTGTADAPVFAPPEPFEAGGRLLWLMAGPPGTIQGPSEVKWGYINPGVGPWPQPNRTPVRAIVCGDALGNNTVYLETPSPSGRGGAGEVPRVSRGRRLHVLREGHWEPLVTRWRCRPQLVDWGDGETVYLQVDEGGKLVCYRILPDGPSAEDGDVHVAPLHLLRHPDGTPVQLDSDFGGRIGRLKLAAVDWDGDGLPDLLMGGSGSQPHGRNPYRKSTVFLLRNVGGRGQPVLAQPEVVPLEAGEVARFGGHSCVPAPCWLDGAGGGSGGGSGSGGSGRRPDLLVGSENGRVYAYGRAYVEGAARVVAAALA
jgi:hypothetical protein